ncbi:MAG: flagellar protein FliS [bacterium]|nr:flagellar protein FliS [bacterium]
MVHQGIRQYQQTTICSQSPERLIVMLYEGTLRFLESARTAADGDLPEMGRHVGRAQKIVLNCSAASTTPSAARWRTNLDALYGFVLRELTDLRLDARRPPHRRRPPGPAPLLAAWRAVRPGTAEQARRNDGPAPTGTGTVVATVGKPAPDSTAAQHSELCLAV